MINEVIAFFEGLPAVGKMIFVSLAVILIVTITKKLLKVVLILIVISIFVALFFIYLYPLIAGDLPNLPEIPI